MSIYAIPNPSAGRLSTMPCPAGGDRLDGYLAALREVAGVDVIVSLQTDAERDHLDLTGEPDAAGRHGMAYHELPIADFSVPGHSEVEPLLDIIDEALDAGKHVAVHCRGGIGRSSLIAAAVLVRHGVSPDDACATISEARGRRVPETSTQREWIEERTRPPWKA